MCGEGDSEDILELAVEYFWFKLRGSVLPACNLVREHLILSESVSITQ